jgi:hypothetical protein
MDLNPPAGSKISIDNSGSVPIVVIPQPGGMKVQFAGLFLAVWLLFGGAPIALKVASGVFSEYGNIFATVLLCPLLLFDAYVAYAVFRVLYRRQVPETLTLSRDGVCYDSGFVALLWKGWWISFPKKLHVDLDRQQLQSLRLRGNVVGQWRLTVDVGADRFDIAPNASGVEREWLAHLLAHNYSLPSVRASGGDDA